jgi:hypothetical protein
VKQIIIDTMNEVHQDWAWAVDVETGLSTGGSCGIVMDVLSGDIAEAEWVRIFFDWGNYGFIFSVEEKGENMLIDVCRRNDGDDPDEFPTQWFNAEVPTSNFSYVFEELFTSQMPGWAVAEVYADM